MSSYGRDAKRQSAAWRNGYNTGSASGGRLRLMHSAHVVRRWRVGFWASLSLALLLVISVTPHLRDSAELVRMRNALLMDPQPAVHDWTPATVPTDFKTDHGRVEPLFAEAVARYDLAVPGDDWETALRIGRHLLGATTPATAGHPIQSDLEDTYRRIIARGEGYCGDFADVFTGLATAAGVFSRPWAFSFEGFGGRGHIFNEVWDRRTGAWLMIDVFQNYYAAGPDDRPLSATAFREALANGATVRLLPVEPRSRPGFVRPEKAFDYYRRGLPEWYLWWGNNVLEADSEPVVRVFGSVSRSLEQLAAIAVGVHPRIRVLQTPENAPQRAAMSRLATHLHVVAVALPLALLAAAFCFWRSRRAADTGGAPDAHS
jgi:hypothetical protein